MQKTMRCIFIATIFMDFGARATEPTNSTAMKSVTSREKLTILGTGPTEAITKECKGMPTGDPVVLTLNENGQMLQELANGSGITRDVKLGGATQVHPPVIDPPYWPTNIDVGISQRSGSTGYTLMKIRIKPKSTNDMIFLRKNSSSNPSKDKNSSTAILVSKGYGKFVCNRSDIQTDEQGFEFITFGIKMPSQQVIPYNIGFLHQVVINGVTSWIPHFIDPNVKNDG